MLDSYTSVIINKLNNFLLKKYNKTEIIKLVNNIELHDKIQENYKNNILMNIVDIKREENDISHDYYEMYGNQYIRKIKPAHFYIYAIFHSTHLEKNITDGLLYLSDIISYINSNPILSSENTIEFKEKNLSEINLYIQNDEQNLYKKLKIPYMPSIILKYGLIPIDSLSQNDKPITSISDF